jgi:hypothetical protein
MADLMVGGDGKGSAEFTYSSDGRKEIVFTDIAGRSSQVSIEIQSKPKFEKPGMNTGVTVKQVVYEGKPAAQLEWEGPKDGGDVVGWRVWWRKVGGKWDSQKPYIAVPQLRKYVVESDEFVANETWEFAVNAYNKDSSNKNQEGPDHKYVKLTFKNESAKLPAPSNFKGDHSPWDRVKLSWDPVDGAAEYRAIWGFVSRSWDGKLTADPSKGGEKVIEATSLDLIKKPNARLSAGTWP